MKEGFRVSVRMAVLGLSLLVPGAVLAVDFFAEDFESYETFEDLELNGWLGVEVNNPIEVSTFWRLVNSAAFTGNDCGRLPPPGESGAPDGSFNWLISDSDCYDGFEDTPDSGMSHDIWSPEIDLSGATEVWLHFDCTAQLNNNGQAVFDVDASPDGGQTWTNVFRHVAPERTGQGATTIPQTTDNADGFFGRAHIDLTEVAAGASQVRIRWRHFEPDWDWWIAIDNVLVDDQPSRGGAVDLIAPESFTGGIPGSWRTRSLADPPNTGEETWHTTDKGGRYVPGVVGGGDSVNRINHPGATPDFAMLDSDANPDPAEDEYLITPAVDCSRASEVFLHYKDEIKATGGALQEVLVSLDGGETFEPIPLFSYNAGGGYDDAEDPFYAERVLSVPLAVGEPEVAFAFHYQSPGDQWWWAIDDVRISASGEGLTQPRNCATRRFTVHRFDPQTASVTMTWNLLAGDEGFRILANGAQIGGDLGPDVPSFTDSSPPPGGSVAYTLQTLSGGSVEFECSSPAVSVVLCPSGLACCVDQRTGEVTLTWRTGANIDGNFWQVFRNGVPRQNVPLELDSYTEILPGPGRYEFELRLSGGDPDQCPNMPLTCTATLRELGSGVAFFDDFEGYSDNAAFQGSCWESRRVPEDTPPPADGSQWTLLPSADACTDRGANPPTGDGTPSAGNYVISDNDCGGVSIAEGTGQSYDLVSPPFSTEGMDKVWLHLHMSAVLNNNGECVVDIDVTTDGEETWTNVLRRVAANRTLVEPFPQAQIPADLPGGPQEGNTDGIYGPVHLDLSEVAAGKAEVRFRVRHFEPNFDWWVAIDDVVVDDQPWTGGNVPLLCPEGFDGGIPETWRVESLGDGLTPWTDTDTCNLSLLNHNGGVFPDEADGRRLHYFDESFALVDLQCTPGAADEFLVTPPVDASAVDNLYLHFRSSIRPTAEVMEVLLSFDGGETFEETPLFTYSPLEGGLFYRDAGNSEIAHDDYIVEAPEAAGEQEVAFAFHFRGGVGWWAVDDVAVTGDGPVPGAEVCCADGTDNDGDGAVDCDDPDCAGALDCPGARFVRGDVDRSGVVNLTDGVQVLLHLFNAQGLPAPLRCLDAADTDDSGGLNLTDGVSVFLFLFRGGDIPVPSPETTGATTGADPGDCAPDPTDDLVECAEPPGYCG